VINVEYLGERKVLWRGQNNTILDIISRIFAWKKTKKTD
jgi:hypothetical protein